MTIKSTNGQKDPNLSSLRGFLLLSFLQVVFLFMCWPLQWLNELCWWIWLIIKLSSKAMIKLWKIWQDRFPIFYLTKNKNSSKHRLTVNKQANFILWLKCWFLAFALLLSPNVEVNSPHNLWTVIPVWYHNMLYLDVTNNKIQDQHAYYNTKVG